MRDAPAEPTPAVTGATPPATHPVPVGPRPPRDWVDLVDRWFPDRYRRPVLVTAAVSLTLTLAFLFLPLAGTDLSAQVARGHFVAAYGWRTIDFRWYGGVYPFGYSMLAPELNATLGARGVGAVSCVVAAVGLAWLLARHRVARPTLGGVLGAAVGVFNLVSGRTTFALGVALGILALVAVSLPGMRRVPRLWLGGTLAALATLGSPVAGLYVGLAGTAVVLTNLRRVGRRVPPERGAPLADRLLRRTVGLAPGRHFGKGMALALGAAIGIVPSTLLFSDGGVQPFNTDSMKVSVAVCLATFFLIPARYRALRAGAVLALGLVLVAHYVPSPIGSNATRLPLLYSAPLVAATAEAARRWLALALGILVWWQPPLVTGDLGNAGAREAHKPFFQPLIDELDRRAPVGRVEVVPLADHWESTFAAEAVPLARGWERQVDVERNPLFYDGVGVTPGRYIAWLDDNAVSYVAVPSHSKLDFAGREEASLIAAGLPYLHQVWSNGDWRLYSVVNSTPLVTGAAVLVSSGPTGVVFDVLQPGELFVRVHWSRWLTLTGPRACLSPTARGGWVRVQAGAVGRYEISSGWRPDTAAC